MPNLFQFGMDACLPASHGEDAGNYPDFFFFLAIVERDGEANIS